MILIPRTVHALNKDGSEMRPVPGYEGNFINRNGVIFSITRPKCSSRTMHPKYARIIHGNNGVKLDGHHRAYKKRLMQLAFPELEYGSK